MNELKIQLKQLWKNIFGDEEDYVDLISDAYFVENNVEYKLDNSGEVISALWAVPYKFYDKINARYFNGLYLCGLATRDEYRGRGIMKNLMNKIENKAEASGYDFCFLIPADDNLRQFYQTLDYKSMKGKFIYDISFKKLNTEDLNHINKNGVDLFKIEKTEDRDVEIIVNAKSNKRYFVSELSLSDDELKKFINDNNCPDVFNFCNHDFKISNAEFEFSDDEIKCEKLKAAYKLLNNWELTRAPLSLIHSPRDFAIAIRECNISGGTVLLLQSCDCKPIALLFCYMNKEAKAIDIRFAALQSEDSTAIMLLYLKLCYFNDVSTVRLNLQSSDTDFRFVKSALRTEVLFSDDTGKGVYSLRLENETPLSLDYGMIKWLNRSRENIISIGESDANSKANSQKDENIVKVEKCQNNKPSDNKGKEELANPKTNDRIFDSETEIMNYKDFALENCKCNLPQFNFLNISLMLD